MSGAGDVAEVSVHGARVGVAPLASAGHDALVLVTAPGVPAPAPLAQTVADAVKLDNSLLKVQDVHAPTSSAIITFVKFNVVDLRLIGQ